MKKKQHFTVDNAFITTTLDSILEEHPRMTKRIMDEVLNGAKNLYRQLGQNTNSFLSGFYQSFDKFLHKEKMESGVVISCKKGCSFCCHIPIDATEMEVDLILQYCKEKNIAINEEYLQAQAATPTTQRLEKGLARCTFLSNAGTCIIYPVRPIICRRYHVASPPELCDTTKGSKEVAILKLPMSEITISSLYTAIQQHTTPIQQTMIEKLQKKKGRKKQLQ